MSQVVKWVRDFESNVGSILIYRATSKEGTYSVIDTIDAKDGSGNFLGSYVDSAGTDDSWYKIQTWNGAGSSAFSDPISAEFWYLFAEIQDVKDELRLNSLSDITDSEIYNSIVDSDDWIYSEYGNPVKKTYTYLKLGSSTYDFTGNKQPIYRLDRVEFQDREGRGTRLPTSSFTINFRQGQSTMDSSFVSSFDGQRIEFEFIPKAYHLLSKYRAALDIAEANLVSDGDEVERPEVRRLRAKFDRVVNTLKPAGLFNERMVQELGEERGPGKYIRQEWYNEY